MIEVLRTHFKTGLGPFRCGWLAFVTAAVFMLGDAFGQESYPNRPVRIIVPFAPGGGTDGLARLMARHLGDKWGNAVVVENRAGADGIIGTDLVAKAPADGYTLLWTVNSHVANPSVKANLPYDAIKSFEPICNVAATPYVLVVNANVAARNATELTALSKAQPGKFSFGSSDPVTRVIGEFYKSISGADLQNITYKGSAPLMNDILGNHIQVGFVSLSSALPHHKQGTLRILGVTSANRSAIVPELPAIAESGLAGFDFSVWFGLLTPSGTRTEIIDKINRDAVAITKQEEFKAALTKVGATPVGSTAEEFGRSMSREMEIVAKTVKAAGIKPQ